MLFLQGIEKEAKALDKLLVRRVPIEWYGVATEVKIMGSFDNWTEGFSLSPSEIQDQTFTRFQSDISLLPVGSIWAQIAGSHRVYLQKI